MRVLITLPVKVGFDGMTKQVLSYGKYMNRDNLEIDLLSCRGFDPDMKYIVDEANFNNVYRMEYRDTDQLRYLWDLIKLIKKRKYDVLHANGQSATLVIEMLAGILGGCKLRIAHAHNSRCLHTRVHKLLYPLFRFTYNDSIACSIEAGKWLFHNDTFFLLPNGINVDQFIFDEVKRRQYRTELGLEESDIAIGHVGAFEPWKNHEFLIDAFYEVVRNNKKFKLYLWGIDGTTKESVFNKIKKLNLDENVIDMGTTDHIYDYLNAMDTMVLPSWYEGFPVTVVEWQANGLRCLVSETVTKDSNITGLVSFLPINKEIRPWVDEILNLKKINMERDNIKYAKMLSKAGYDIRNNAQELKKHYEEKVGE